MVFRITPQHIAGNSIRYSQLHLARLTTLQSQVSSGLRIQKPSDDPGALGSLYANKASVARIEIDTANIERARGKLNQSVAQLISAEEALSRANRLALSGVQAIDTERETLAQEVDGILNLLLQVANATDGGEPLFAGTSKIPDPFQAVRGAQSLLPGEQGTIQAVTYSGSQQRSRVVVGALTTVDALYAGSEIFQTTSRGETVFVGQTGAAAGSGTDSAVGYGTLSVRQTGTLYTGGSGLQPGTSSAADTIIGDHVLTVDAVNQTLSLDGGTAVMFTSGDTDVLVYSPQGAALHVDTSSLVVGFSGDVVVQGQGTLSIDGGLSEVAIDFTQNQILTDATTGAVTNVDSRAIRMAGQDQVEYLGTSSVFQALIDLRDELLNTRQLTGQDWKDAMTRRLGEIQRVHEHLLEVIGEQSVSLENLDALEFRANDYKLETQRVIAAAESLDVSQAVVELQSEQNALQFTYAVSVQLMTTSLLDFLR
jgi:flagellar hook-associated protein 3